MNPSARGRTAGHCSNRHLTGCVSAESVGQASRIAACASQRPPRDLPLPHPTLVPANCFNHLAESIKARVSSGTIFRDALLRSLARDIEN